MSKLLPWQTSVWADLVKRDKNGGLPHALLFTGSKGIGKHELALHLAQWLLCQRARAEQKAEACGECHSCKLWQAGSHPDFILSVPEDGSRQIRIDNVRRINEFLVQTPQISRCQVVIMHPVEVMNVNAANSLLKTLEEPAGESYLILETERFGSVLPTIRSRCQRLVLQTPSNNEAQQWLLAKGANAAQIDTALRLNQGAPLAALEWLNSDAGKAQQLWLGQLRQWSQNEVALQTVAESWAKLELNDVMFWFYTVLSDLVKGSLGVAAAQQTLAGEAFSVIGNATLSSAKLLPLQAKVQGILGQLLSGLGNYNKQLLCESLLLEWQNVLHSASAQSGDMG